MPRPIKRFIQKWIISHRARKQVTREEINQKMPHIRAMQWLARLNTGKKTSDDAHQHAKQNIDHATAHFAITRAFRAAGIFGNETRNELSPLIRGRRWRELSEKIGERRTNRIRQVFGQAIHVATEATNEQYTNDQVLHETHPQQNPIHGILRHMRSTSPPPRKKVA